MVAYGRSDTVLTVEQRVSGSLQRVDTSAVPTICVSQGSSNTQGDQEINAEITEYAELHDLSVAEATEELLQTGLTAQNQTTSAPPTTDTKQRRLEQRQQALAGQQRQIVRFQKRTVLAGIGWAVLTVATGETGPLWTAIGMLTIVLMAASPYIWQWIPYTR